MSTLKTTLRRFVNEESGATMVEYAIMVALISVVCIAAVVIIGTKSNAAFTTVNTTLP